MTKAKRRSNTGSPDRVTRLVEAVRAFAEARDWEQYHSPKNLSMALTAEAGELLEIFQWLTEAESRALAPTKRSQVRDEIGDILIYLTRLADQIGIDPIEAAFDKIKKNEAKYPVAKAKGNARKYTEFKR